MDQLINWVPYSAKVNSFISLTATQQGPQLVADIGRLWSELSPIKMGCRCNILRKKTFKHDKSIYSYNYIVLFLTVPPDFQYQNEKQILANQDYFFKKFTMYKSFSLTEQVFFLPFWYWKWGGAVKKSTLYI